MSKNQLNQQELHGLLPEREDMQVYKDTFDLLVFVYQTTVSMKREHRFTLAEEMKRAVTDLLTCIYEAKKNADFRVNMLDRAMHHTYRAKVLFRVMAELQLLKNWQMATYIEKLATISKQLTAWQRYEKRKLKQQHDNDAQSSVGV